MAERVVLFLDYQNIYKGARTCFHDLHAPHMSGQISPLLFGEYLIASSPYERELEEVRVYRGRPDASHDPKGYAACTRQIDVWQQSSRVTVITRALRYPYGWPHQSQPGEKPQEKGIDVALAIDFVALAIQGRYDVGILMSTDTDLKPALEAVVEFGRGNGGKPRVEVAAWSGSGMHNRRLAIRQKNLWCHWLDEQVYQQVKDVTDYSKA